MKKKVKNWDELKLIEVTFYDHSTVEDFTKLKLIHRVEPKTLRIGGFLIYEDENWIHLAHCLTNDNECEYTTRVFKPAIIKKRKLA